jgi:dTDP-glucose 4,6-dehydratase
MPKRLLLTGIAGFAGSHALEHVLEKTDWEIVGLTTFRHRGDPLRLDIDLWNPERITIFHCDLQSDISPRLIERIGPIDYIWNLASESHVDRSITDPRPFIENNVSVAITMLELARIIKPSIFIQISTDEVYGPAPDGVDFKEWSPIVPSNPYSASKAAQEAIAISYWRTYSVPLIITNTMNLLGERQDTEKFIPMSIAKINAGKTVTIHGNENEIGSRFYLHARNHADALLFLTENVRPTLFMRGEHDKPDRFNVRGEREVDNLEMAQMIADIMDKPLRYELVDFHKERPGHDPRYALDDQKLRALGWEPPVPLYDSLKKAVEWTLKNPEWLS